MLTSGRENFIGDEKASLRIGLAAVSFISMDDTVAPHARPDGMRSRSTVPASACYRQSAPSSGLKSSRGTRDEHEDCAINYATLNYMRHRRVALDVIARLATHPETSSIPQMA